MREPTCTDRPVRNGDTTASPGASQHQPARASRVLLVGVAAFAWLRKLQERAPGPRIDLRYLVEGAVVLLEGRPELRQLWLEQARRALVEHVAGAGDRGSVGNTQGTGRRQSAEGAAARTSASSVNPAHHDDCKALQVGERAFQWLKSVQGTTRDPRLDMRYLVEGALALLDREPSLLPRVLGHARRSLLEHLQQLDQQPIDPFTLEKHP